MLQQLHRDKENVSSNSTATTDAVRLFFEKMRKVLSQREKALLSTIQKYGDIKLTRLDTHHQKLREHHDAILEVVDKIEKMIQNGENVDVLLQKQAISEELDVHQQSVLIMLAWRMPSPGPLTSHTRSLQYPVRTCSKNPCLWATDHSM